MIQVFLPASTVAMLCANAATNRATKFSVPALRLSPAAQA
jgi:hypothetical protein